MSVQSEIDRIDQNIKNAYAVLGALGAELPTEQNSDNLASTAGTAKAVLYAPQELSEEEQTQARDNIGAASEDDLAELSNEKVDKTGISLGIGADGLIYIHVDGAPVGTGIEQGASGDVIGYVDENNNIILTGTLPEDTYNVKYEMEDGTTVDIGELSFAPPATYTNLVPTSIDTDGSVYNGVGYMDGVRGNSSGTTTALSGATTSGLIPIDLKTDTICVAGVDRAQSAVSDANYTYVVFYNADRTVYAFAKAGGRQMATIGYKDSGWPIVDSNGVEVLYSPDNTGSIDMKTTAGDYETVRDAIKYFKVTGKGSGANFIITKNEEIV